MKNHTGDGGKRGMGCIELDPSATLPRSLWRL